MAPKQEPSPNVDEEKKNLFQSAMKGDWKEVIDIHEHHPSPELYREMITKSGDTALHVAVLNGKEDIVEKLVEIISKTDKKALKVGNERGDTPLHLAAEMGNTRICKCIAETDPELIGARNCDQETPLYVAVLNGNKDAFCCLQKIIGKEKGLSYCRGKDGDTILHSAINGDHLDLAFQIIDHYEDLVHSVNHFGLTPLHVLASKPSAFRSGSGLPWYREIIYRCTFVNEPKVEKMDEEGKVPNHPENYHHFFQMFRDVFHAHFIKRSDSVDTESQTHGGHHRMLPPNCGTCFAVVLIILLLVVKLPFMAMLNILARSGFKEIRRVQETKRRHYWSVLVMNKLLDIDLKYKYKDNGQKPPGHDGVLHIGNVPMEHSEANKADSDYKNETPILMAAKNGTTEMVKEILKLCPVAIHDENTEKKNVVLLAVENRQPHVYSLLHEMESTRDAVFRKVDKDGNSALHLAAKLGNYRPWNIPGDALQMEWEVKWYRFVKKSMPRHFFRRHNDKGETPENILKEKHKDLVKAAGKWLTSTSESCSVVAALIATVAFATSSTVPGGVDETNGKPILENEPAFGIFAISSLVALCFSVTSMVMFLSILTSRYQEKEFGTDLPIKLLLGLTSLFVSIGSILVSFCAGHFFVLKAKLKYSAFPVYAVTCLPVTFYALAQFPLYWDLIRATFKKVPQRHYAAVTS